MESNKAFEKLAISDNEWKIFFNKYAGGHIGVLQQVQDKNSVC